MSQAGQPRPTYDRHHRDDRSGGGHEREDALLDWDSHDVREGHWKISVVQSPP
jgi:hypothetical protein